MAGNFICSQLENCHANDADAAVYAYFRSPPSEDDWDEALESECDGNIGLIRDEACEYEDREEVPSTLSNAAGFRRYYLGGAG